MAIHFYIAKCTEEKNNKTLPCSCMMWLPTSLHIASMHGFGQRVIAIVRDVKHAPKYSASVIAFSRSGQGAACSSLLLPSPCFQRKGGWKEFRTYSDIFSRVGQSSNAKGWTCLWGWWLPPCLTLLLKGASFCSICSAWPWTQLQLLLNHRTAQRSWAPCREVLSALLCCLAWAVSLQASWQGQRLEM